MMIDEASIRRRQAMADGTPAHTGSTSRRIIHFFAGAAAYSPENGSGWSSHDSIHSRDSHSSDHRRRLYTTRIRRLYKVACTLRCGQRMAGLWAGTRQPQSTEKSPTGPVRVQIVAASLDGVPVKFETTTIAKGGGIRGSCSRI